MSFISHEESPQINPIEQIFRGGEIEYITNAVAGLDSLATDLSVTVGKIDDDPYTEFFFNFDKDSETFRTARLASIHTDSVTGGETNTIISKKIDGFSVLTSYSGERITELLVEQYSELFPIGSRVIRELTKAIATVKRARDGRMVILAMEMEQNRMASLGETWAGSTPPPILEDKEAEQNS